MPYTRREMLETVPEEVKRRRPRWPHFIRYADPRGLWAEAPWGERIRLQCFAASSEWAALWARARSRMAKSTP